jgi:hypothetical protein
LAINTNNNSQGPSSALALAEAFQLLYRNLELLAELRAAVEQPSQNSELTANLTARESRHDPGRSDRIGPL